MKEKDQCIHNLIKEHVVPEYIEGTGVQVQLLNIRHIFAHYHSFVAEFIYVLEGEVVVNAAHERVVLHAGELFMVDIGDARNIYSEQDNVTLLVHMNMRDAGISDEILNGTLFFCETKLMNGKNRKTVDMVCDKLLAMALAASAEKIEEKKRILEKIRTGLVKLMLERCSWFEVEHGNGKYDERLCKITNYIRTHYKSRITISGMAEILYLNPSYVSAFLRRTSFASFTHMLNYFRCLEAQRMLLSTDTSIGDISGLCGFSSEKYFYRSFKLYFQTTPLQYRKRFERYAGERELYYRIESEKAYEMVKEIVAGRCIEKAVAEK